MKNTSIRIGWALAALALAGVSSVSFAHGGGHYHHGSRLSFGVTLGAPLWYPGPYYYPYPAYTYPAPVVVQQAPRVYVERDDPGTLDVPSAPSTSANAATWYYCRDTNTYYPYVRECASPWERVPAKPTTAR